MNKTIRKAIRHGHELPVDLINKSIADGTLDTETCIALLAALKDDSMHAKVKLYMAVKEKLDILCDFAIIRESTAEHTAMFEVLKRCKSDSEIDRTVHDLLTGSETLSHFLARKEAEING